MLLAAAVGVAFVSRVAKNFQDYFINVITQRLGARSYADGIRHSLALPYQVFEDQRSGETLGILQKARADVEKLISQSINLLFTTLVGIVFVMIYAFYVHWVIAPIFLATVPLLGMLSSVLSRRIKKVQTEIVNETTALAGSTTESLRNIELVKSLGLGPQEVARLNSTTDRILQLELQEGAVPPQPELRPGHGCERASNEHPVPDALPDLHAGDHRRAVLLAVHLLVLHLRAAAGTRQRRQHLPGDRSVDGPLPADPADAGRAQGRRSPCAVSDLQRLAFEARAVHAPDRVGAGAGRRELLGAPRRDGRVRRALRARARRRS